MRGLFRGPVRQLSTVSRSLVSGVWMMSGIVFGSGLGCWIVELFFSHVELFVAFACLVDVD